MILETKYVQRKSYLLVYPSPSKYMMRSLLRVFILWAGEFTSGVEFFDINRQTFPVYAVTSESTKKLFPFFLGPRKLTATVSGFKSSSAR